MMEFQTRGIATGWQGIATRRMDWEQVSLELYSRVVHEAPFAATVISKEQTWMGTTLRLFPNPHHTDPFIATWIRNHITLNLFDRLFWLSKDLQPDTLRPVCLVVSSGLGLPPGYHLIRVAGRSPVSEAALIIFGHEASNPELNDLLLAIQAVTLKPAVPCNR